MGNPLNELCKLIAKMQDEKGRITIPGFYDDVVELTEADREMTKRIPFDEAAYKAGIKVKELYGEEGYHTLERTGSRPSFDLCGIWGGYQGEGAKTILPSKAFAKVSTRLVANQDEKKIAQAFIDYVHKLTPDHVDVKVEYLHGGTPYLCPSDLPIYKVAEEAYEATFGKKPLAVRSGGSIPIIATFERVLGVKSILMGFGLGSDAIHSPNENFPLYNFHIGMGLNVYNLILAVNFFKNLPAELEEAALVDGAGPWKCLTSIFIPLAKPVIATIALFTIVQYWNEFFQGMVLSTNQSNYPLQTYIQQLVVNYDFSTMNVEQIAQVQKLNNQSLDAAKIVIAMIPVLAVYPFLQKYFVTGITLGSVKG